jgi:hypothetical protein
LGPVPERPSPPKGSVLPKVEVKDVGDDRFRKRRGVDDHRILPARLGDERRDRAEPGVIAAPAGTTRKPAFYPADREKQGNFLDVQPDMQQNQ